MDKRIMIMVLLCAGVVSGCRRADDPQINTNRVKIDLRGSVGHIGDSRAIVHPLTGGLPPEQLRIAIVTTELDSQDPTYIPTPGEWDNSLTYLDHGFFGGNLPGDSPGMLAGDWNGNIEYTNRAGTALQQVFYDETGVYYYFVCVSPYGALDDPEGSSMVLDSEGASVIFTLDGSQDVMASTMGHGNLANPWAGVLQFSHKLTCLNCLFIAESADAEDSYGEIVSVTLLDQPSRATLNIGKQAVAAVNADAPLKPVTGGTKTNYPMVGTTADRTLPVGTEANMMGYILAMPAAEYTFRITTSERGDINPLFATYTFDSGPLPGTIYNLTFKMLESAKVVLEVKEAKAWWLGQTFD